MFCTAGEYQSAGAGVAGVASPDGGHVGAGFVVLAPDASTTTDEILDGARRELPAHAVPATIRQLSERDVPDTVLAVADAGGQVVALVYDQAAAAVPVERRPWVPVDSVARTLEPGRTLPADLAGEDVIRAVQANPAPVYLVVSGDGVVGVLRTADLARLLNS